MEKIYLQENIDDTINHQILETWKLSDNTMHTFTTSCRTYIDALKAYQDKCIDAVDFLINMNGSRTIGLYCKGEVKMQMHFDSKQIRKSFK